MTPDDVTVADANGNVLHAPGMDLSSGRRLAAADRATTTRSAQQCRRYDRDGARARPRRSARAVRPELRPDRRTTSLTNTAPAGTGSTPLPDQQSTQQTRTLTERRGRRDERRARRRHKARRTRPAAAADARPTSKTTNQSDNAVNQVAARTSSTPPGKFNRLSVSVLLDSAVGEARRGREAGPSRSRPRPASTETRRRRRRAGRRRSRSARPRPKRPRPSQLGAQRRRVRTRCSISSSTSLTLLMIGLVLFFAWRAIKKAEANRVPLRVPLDLRELEAGRHALALEAPGSRRRGRRAAAGTSTARNRRRPGSKARSPTSSSASPTKSRRPCAPGSPTGGRSRGISGFTGSQKAAILLMQAGKERAATVLRSHPRARSRRDHGGGRAPAPPRGQRDRRGDRRVPRHVHRARPSPPRSRAAPVRWSLFFSHRTQDRSGALLASQQAF